MSKYTRICARANPGLVGVRLRGSTNSLGKGHSVGGINTHVRPDPPPRSRVDIYYCQEYNLAYSKRLTSQAVGLATPADSLSFWGVTQLAIHTLFEGIGTPS